MAIDRRLLLLAPWWTIAHPLPGAAAPASGNIALALDRTRSVLAVRDLQVSFALDVSAGNWRAAADLFADGAIADWNGMRLRGRRAILSDLPRRLGGGGAPGDLHALLALSPVVTLAKSGRYALARWHEVGLFGGAGVTDNWTGGIYEIRYIREHGRWRIAELRYRPQFRGSYAVGWRTAVSDLKITPYHYQAEELGRPVTSVSHRAQAPHMADGAIAGYARRLADEGALRNLQNIYGYYLDRRMWSDALDLFAPGALYSTAGTGTFKGAAAIRQALETEGPEGLNYGDLNDHILTNMRVCVAPDGRSARLRGMDFGWSGRNNAQAYWSLTQFDTSFVKSGGIWRISALRRYPMMRTGSTRHWDEGIEPLPRPTRPPDGPAIPPVPFPRTCRAPLPVKAARATIKMEIEEAAAAVAIENVSNAFGNYIDDYEWKNLSRLFTRDGLREAPGIGFYQSPDRIFEMQSTRYGPLASPRRSIPIHARLQPVIHFGADGQSAKLRTRLMQFNAAFSSSGGVMGGIYEDEVRLEEGKWRLSMVEIDHYLQTRNYADLWTKVPEGLGQQMLPRLDALRALPPDRPLVGEVAAPFPAIGQMWFHYVNPVSGRRPAWMTPKNTAVRSAASAGKENTP